jgi:hypothetical protein
MQPLARLRGLVRGLMNPPDDVAPEPAALPAVKRWLPSPRGIGTTARLLLGETVTRRFWGESWTGIEGVLTSIVKDLRAARVRAIAVDDGWQPDRDISVSVGPWARVDLKALVEEHAQGKVLLRVAMRLRLTGLGAVALGTLLALVTAAGARWPVVAGLGSAPLLAIASFALFTRFLRAGGALERAVARTASLCAMVPVGDAARGSRWPQKLAWGLRGTAAAVLLGIVSLSASVVRSAAPAASTSIPRSQPAAAIPHTTAVVRPVAAPAPVAARAVRLRAKAPAAEERLRRPTGIAPAGRTRT